MIEDGFYGECGWDCLDTHVNESSCIYMLCLHGSGLLLCSGEIVSAKVCV